MPIPFASQLPYTLHTNRELGLMLAGEKPLAMFIDGYGAFPDVVCRYLRLFDRHVATGRFVRRDQILPPSPHHDFTIHRIFFALADQEWRIDAMIALKASTEWSRDHERREGQLLGYEEWMTDHFLDRFYPTVS